MLPLRWPWRRSEPLEKTDGLFPYVSTSAVNPKLLVSLRRRRNWSPWVLLASLSGIAILSPLLAKSKVILGLLHRINISGSWLHNSEAFLWVGVGCIVSFSVLTLWLLPRWQVSSFKTLTPEARFDKENESRKTLAQIVGGLFVIASLFSTARTLEVSQEQAATAAENVKVSQKQAATAAEQVRIAQEGQFTDRFTKAIDQLGR